MIFRQLVSVAGGVQSFMSVQKCRPRISEQTIMLKMADQGRSDFCVVFTMSLCALELKRTLISLLFQIIRL